MKIRLVIPLKMPSKNKIIGRNRFELHAKRTTWHEMVSLMINSQVSSEQRQYFRARMGEAGVTYVVTITARLFRKYDGDNPFPKWGIDGLKGILIKDDSLKYIGEPIVKQEIIPAKRIGSKKAGTLRYVNAQGKQVYPETIIEVELVERQEVML